MAAALEIRPLRTEDDRSTFSCGQPDLDRFFQHYAAQNQFRLHLAVTYIATADAHTPQEMRWPRLSRRRT